MAYLQQELPTETATEQFGAAIARASINQPLTLFLVGNLGTGKTTVVRGFLCVLGYTGKVTSPTFTLLEAYQLPTGNFFHFDLYRINNPAELAAIGWHDYFASNNTCLVEWPERAGTEIPAPDLVCELEMMGETRRASLHTASAIGELILSRLTALREGREVYLF